MIGEELVAAGAAELTLLEQDADFTGAAAGIIRHHLHYHRNLVGRIPLVDDMLERGAVAPVAGSLGDRPLDDIARDTRLPGLFHGRIKTGIGLDVTTPELRGNGDLLDQLL